MNPKAAAMALVMTIFLAATGCDQPEPTPPAAPATSPTAASQAATGMPPYASAETAAPEEEQTLTPPEPTAQVQKATPEHRPTTTIHAPMRTPTTAVPTPTVPAETPEPTPIAHRRPTGHLQQEIDLYYCMVGPDPMTPSHSGKTPVPYCSQLRPTPTAWQSLGRLAV